MSLPPNARAVRRVLYWTMAANLAVAAAKFAYARASGSVALFADALHSTFDGTANVIGLVALHFAYQPADEGHPYGHAKFESAASVAIGGMLVASLVEIAQRAWAAAAEGNRPDITAAGLWLVAASASVSAVVSFLENRAGKRLHSDILAADARHTFGDVAASATIFASFIGVRAGFGWADIAGALVAAVTIAVAAYQVLRRGLGILVDEARIPAERVHEVARGVGGVLGSHSARTRGAPHAVLCDLSITVEGGISVERGHAIGHAVERRLREAFPSLADVVVHVEPQG